MPHVRNEHTLHVRYWIEGRVYVGMTSDLLGFCTFSFLFCMFRSQRANWHSSATLTEVFPCVFLSCKANARVYFTKTGHSPHSSQLVNCDFYVLFVLIVLFYYCLCVNVYWLPPCVNPIAVNKYISYHIIYAGQSLVHTYIICVRVNSGIVCGLSLYLRKIFVRGRCPLSADRMENSR